MTTRSLSIPPAAWFGILAVASLWGGSFLSMRVAGDEVPTLTIVAIRVGGAALVLWIYVLAMGIRVPRGVGLWASLAVMGLFNNVLPFSLITWGERHIASGLASILNASTAIFGVLVAAAVLSDEQLTRRKVLGVALGFAGVATATGLEALSQLDLRSLAQLAVILASFCYAISGAWARVRLTGIAPEAAAAGMLTCSALIMVPATLLIDGVPTLDYSMPAVAALAYLAVFASAVAYMIFYRLLARIGAANTSVVTLLVAPIAIVLGAVVLGETLRPAAYAGFALLSLGLLVLDGRLAAWVGRMRAA
ncbi:DMT family transporter [Frigidibacter sp. ROC022]|uniref:DMT family transporter n=1 Tax=Frigidibacter sp. ROC022 TaxID=2971796 RepID=UPI00215B0EA9|nr:DMT family transporter [Frigidibacter sp. ROC022]MCR8726336.1 DMT family transporter [Frigidibacter sp. ROC022]